MINGALRPWGRVEWLLQMASVKSCEWTVIGAVSTQDRCLSIPKHAGSSFKASKGIFLDIIDSPSIYSADSASRRQANRARIQQYLMGTATTFVDFGLFDPLSRLKSLVTQWTNDKEFSRNILLDVSAIPERILFPLLRWLVSTDRVENLAVTYMLPTQYTREDLGYDPQEWSHLPTFITDEESSDSPIQNVIVGAGFLPYSLPDWLRKTYSHSRSMHVSILFPFPAAPAGVSRAWEFVRRIEVDMAIPDDRQIVRVGMHDVSSAFDRIQTITKQGASRAVFAPYGPKPHSVAMCLHAIRYDCPAYFTQPQYYHPEYSTGILEENGVPCGYAYFIRLNSNTLY